jgi:hypothetical protein
MKTNDENERNVQEVQEEQEGLEEEPLVRLRRSRVKRFRSLFNIKPQKKIFKDKICSICLGKNNGHLPLICGHVFCKEDTESLIRFSPGEFPCPHCRQP